MERRKRILAVLFAMYCLVMLWLLFGRAEAPAGIPYIRQLKMRMNWIPLRTLRLQLRLLSDWDRPHLIRHAAVNLLGNLVLFAPLGVFLPGLWPRLGKLWKLLLTVAMIIVTVEITQVLTLLGRCDIDDLLLNLSGAAMGYGSYRWMKELRRPV